MDQKSETDKELDREGDDKIDCVCVFEELEILVCDPVHEMFVEK